MILNRIRNEIPLPISIFQMIGSIFKILIRYIKYSHDYNIGGA